MAFVRWCAHDCHYDTAVLVSVISGEREQKTLVAGGMVFPALPRVPDRLPLSTVCHAECDQQRRRGTTEPGQCEKYWRICIRSSGQRALHDHCTFSEWWRLSGYWKLAYSRCFLCVHLIPLLRTFDTSLSDRRLLYPERPDCCIEDPGFFR